MRFVIDVTTNGKPNRYKAADSLHVFIAAAAAEFDIPPWLLSVDSVDPEEDDAGELIEYSVDFEFQYSPEPE